MMPQKQERMVTNDRTETTFLQFLEIVRKVRKECPWDREQTHQSIRHSLIEEAYEVVESIDNGNLQELKEELGDLLLHVALHSVMAEEKNAFAIEDVMTAISEKLVRRHPHVFGEGVKAGTPHEVKTNWERIKLEEGRESVVDGVPKELPSMLRALRIQEKASKVGFDWKRKEDVWLKIEEEIREFRSAETSNDRKAMEEELGDLFFALVNYARFLNINAEFSLNGSTEKFITRFKRIEKELNDSGKDVQRSTLEEMDALWNSHKQKK